MKNYQSKMLSAQSGTSGKEKGRGIRFLYSPVSRILTIHYLHLLPYHSSEVNPVSTALSGEIVELKPVFLARSLSIMKQLRPDHSDVEIENGLVFRQQPNNKKLVFESGTTDTFFYKRKSPLDLNEEFLH
jgi:hypothetical protein